MNVYYAKSSKKMTTIKNIFQKLQIWRTNLGWRLEDQRKQKLQDFFMTQENMGNVFKVCFQESTRE